jgi:hypothetical protein
MIYNDYMIQLESKLRRATDQELRAIANSNDADSKKVANQILLERLNSPAKRTGRLESNQ